MATGFKLDPKDRRVIKVLLGLENRTKQGLRQGMSDSGNALIKSASDAILSKEKFGKTYFIRDKLGRRRRHVASAPGETHANLTGATRRSLSFQIEGSTSFEFGYGISASKDAPEYAEELERTRPSLKIAIEKNLGITVQHLEKNINDAINDDVTNLFL